MRYNVFVNDKNYAILNYKIGSSKELKLKIIDKFERGIYTPFDLTSYVKGFIVGFDYAKEITITNAALGECEVDLSDVATVADTYNIELWFATSLITTSASGKVVPNEKDVIPAINKLSFVVEASNTFV